MSRVGFGLDACLVLVGLAEKKVGSRRREAHCELQSFVSQVHSVE